MQISIWVLGMLACAGNLFVVIWRVRTERAKVSSFFIINLGMSDFLMGVYMLIIASVDVYYRGIYILEADKWRASWLCQTAGILAMLSSEVRESWGHGMLTLSELVALCEVNPPVSGEFPSHKEPAMWNYFSLPYAWTRSCVNTRVAGNQNSTFF